MAVTATNLRNLRTFLLVSQFDSEGIGARIQQARNEKGLSQEELADMADGFKKRSLQLYESGNTIPFKHLAEIGRLLNKHPAWFLYGDRELPDDRLTQLEDAVAVLPTREDLERGLEALREAIDAQANPGTRPNRAADGDS